MGIINSEIVMSLDNVRTDREANLNYLLKYSSYIAFNTCLHEQVCCEHKFF